MTISGNVHRALSHGYRRRFPLIILLGLALSACETTKEMTETGSTNAASYDALMRLAENTRRQGDLFTATTLYRRAQAANPKRVEPLIALGDVLTDQGSPREALDAWRQALARTPNNMTVLLGYGRALIALDQPEEAALQYTTVLATTPSERRALNGLGVAKDMMNDHAGAQEQFQTALATMPNDATTLNNLGFSYILAGNAPEAIRILEPLARAPTASALQRQNLALAYGVAGRDQDAARIGRLDLDDAAVQRNLSYYRQARVGEAELPGGAADPTQAATPTPASPEGVYAQIGTYRNSQVAHTQWTSLSKKYAALLKPLTPLFIPDAEVVHVRVAFPRPSEAASFCGHLQAAKLSCAVLKSNA